MLQARPGNRSPKTRSERRILSHMNWSGRWKIARWAARARMDCVNHRRKQLACARQAVCIDRAKLNGPPHNTPSNEAMHNSCVAAH